jgi:hypothetical protein
MDGKDLLITVFGLCVLWGAYGVLRPLVSALAKRIADGPKREGSADQLPLLRAELLDELQQVRQQVGDLAERLDFAERLLAKQREGERLAPPRGS